MAQMQLWRSVAIALMTFILGFGVPYLVNRSAATKDDVTNAVIPLQKQLDDQSSQIGALRNGAEQTDLDIARIAAKLNIPAHPIP